MNYQQRQQQLQGLNEVDAVVLVPSPNLLYFTGLDFHLSERPILAIFTPDGACSIIVPELELPRIHARPEFEVRAFTWTDTEGYTGAFAQAIQELGLSGKTLGVDGLMMRVTEWLAFQNVDASLQVSAIEKQLTRIRAHKQPDEIDLMRRAIAMSETALKKLLAWVQPGMTERQIARRLDEELIAQGCEGLAFGTLVQTGPNSALPHGNTTDRALQAGEFLLIDYGGSVENYPADITRTFCLGEPGTEMQKIYDTVLAANRAAVNAAGPGVPMGEVDRAARSVIEAAGYGPYFIHRTGHGLGLDVHEAIPQIASGVTDLLEPGMTFTIEPGIYIPNLGGVRIEDNVVVTDTGLDVLTSFPRQLSV